MASSVFGNYTHTLSLWRISQNVAANTSLVGYSYAIHRNTSATYGAWGTRSLSGSCSGDASGSASLAKSQAFDFRNYADLTVISGSFTVTHNADGTGSASATATWPFHTSGMPGGTVNASLALPTIPRATTPTVSPTSGETAETFTIDHTPATTSFYHDVAYSLDGGDTYTDIATDVVGTDPSTDWTPAHSLIPDAASATAIIRLITRASSGGTIIGTKTVNLPLAVPASVKPVVSSVAWADTQTSSPDIPTMMGGADRFVQRWSRLEPTVTSAGAGGSTVVDTSIVMAGQETTSGEAFTNPVDSSGSVSFSALATDTRGRASDPYYNTVPVRAYNFPNLPTPIVTRTSDAGGTLPSPTGTYLRITPLASVSSLDFGDGEKNLLEWRVRTRPKGGSWTTVQDWTDDAVSGNTWTTPVVYGGYSASSEFEVEVSIRDAFGAGGFDAGNTVKTLSVLVPTESVFMDWDRANGIGLGQYHSGSGARLQVAGGIEQDGEAVVDVSMVASEADAGIIELATEAEVIAGTDAERAVTPAGLSAAMAPLQQGHRLLATVEFTSSGTFEIADHPGAKALRVRLVGGGGGGGGSAATGASPNCAYGYGGGGGGYAEKFIDDLTGLSSVTVTVGAGGLGGVPSSGGTSGGTSSFGTFASATGGAGGPIKPNSALGSYLQVALAGVGTVGDLRLPGSPGGAGFIAGSALGSSGVGGASHLGGGAPNVGANLSPLATAGIAATGYGGGGGGAYSSGSAAGATGGAGAPGVVIVEVFA